jgi:hypothetical protein
VLFSIVSKNKADTRIVVTGESPRRTYSSRARHSKHTSHPKRIRSAGFGGIFD